MIDFKNGTFVKLKKTDNSAATDATAIYVDGEHTIGCYKGIRDYVVFTNKRIISVNVQGVTGKKKDFTTLPYSKIQAFSIETAGVMDIDSELDIAIDGLGDVRFEFSGKSDIIQIGKLISSHIL